METIRSEWDKEKYLTSEKMMAVSVKNYNNFLTSGRCYNKDPKDADILALGGVSQNLADKSNKSSDKPNREPTKGDIDYIRYLPPWML